MRGHLVGFHFCPILLSGVALFLVAFSSSLHTDLSRDEVFERVEGNSVITPYFFPTFYTLLIPLYTLLATTNPSFRRNVNVSGAMGEKSDRMTDFGCHDKLHIIPTDHTSVSFENQETQSPTRKTRSPSLDPEKSGNPLRVYCDMSRYGGK